MYLVSMESVSLGLEKVIFFMGT